MPALKAYKPIMKEQMIGFTVFLKAHMPFFGGIHAILWRHICHSLEANMPFFRSNTCHVSMSSKRRSGSTHSTRSLEGVTFLAVAIVDKIIGGSLTM